MTTENRRMLTGFMIIGAVLIVWSFFLGGKKAGDSVVVIATIDNISVAQHDDSLSVRYIYQGKSFANSFTIPVNDSLKKDIKVKLLVSDDQPGKFIKYIGLAE